MLPGWRRGEWAQTVPLVSAARTLMAKTVPLNTQLCLNTSRPPHNSYGSPVHIYM